ncbi:MAG: matrixin family metalloprotease [Acidobacteriota bacterium]
MPSVIQRALRASALILALTAGAQAYYHFVHFVSRQGPFTPIPEKFDLDALLNKTVFFIVSETGPAAVAPGDSIEAIGSQLRLAAKAWNDVATSDLRIAFGGFAQPGAFQSSPVVEVVFDEVPPGLVAAGGVTARGTVANGPNGAFIPIQRSTVIMRRDLTERPSWTEALFLTMVHELGHTLGLQHTMTSSAMSTEITRAMTKASPLSPDDVAGISLLYPAQGYLASTGTIAGRVAIGAEAVNLASVVALSPDGSAISALTNPDGTYTLQGLPPGSYYLYAHPLPPQLSVESFPANITPPSDLEGRPIPASGSFDTVFFPGVKNAALATIITVGAGSQVNGIDFNVKRRTAPAIYAVQTYSYPGPVAVKPAFLNTYGGRNYFIAAGVGLTTATGVTPGLQMSVIGGSAVIAPGSIRPYPSDGRYMTADFNLAPFPGEGSKHLVFAAGDDIYVLPGGFHIVNRAPPVISSIAPDVDQAGNPVFHVNGTGLTADTRILFDGAVATTRSFNATTGLVVNAPASPPGHTATVVALNRDGQSSLFLQGNQPPTFELDAGDTPSFTVTPNLLSAGTETMVEILGTGTNFQSGQVALAFGSADAVVRRLWVTGPNRIVANVVVAANATQGGLMVTVVNGLRTTGLPNGIQVNPGARATVRGAVTEAGSGRLDVVPGSAAVAQLAGLSSEQGQVQVTLNGSPVQSAGISGGVLTFTIPSGTPAGPAALRVKVNSEELPPIAVSVDLPPPSIAGVFSGGTKIDLTRPARPGEVITVVVAGAGDLGGEVASSRLKVQVDGQLLPVLQIGQNADGTYSVQVQLDGALTAGAHMLTVAVDARVSPMLSLPVR